MCVCACVSNTHYAGRPSSLMIETTLTVEYSLRDSSLPLKKLCQNFQTVQNELQRMAATLSEILFHFVCMWPNQWFRFFFYLNQAVLSTVWQNVTVPLHCHYLHGPLGTGAIVPLIVQLWDHIYIDLFKNIIPGRNKWNHINICKPFVLNRIRDIL